MHKLRRDVDHKLRVLQYADQIGDVGRHSQLRQFHHIINSDKVFGTHRYSANAICVLSYMSYCNGTRAYLSLNKDTPMSRADETAGRIICHPILGGLHHQYTRI